MPRLPRISGRDVVKVFQRHGWVQARQSGSHMIRVREGHPATLSVPDHKDVAAGALRRLIRGRRVDRRRICRGVRLVNRHGLGVSRTPFRSR